jgi:hypothetical protein
MPEIAPMKLQCDLVMRGGIASGLVYPRAIAKLAETHDPLKRPPLGAISLPVH